MATMSWGNTSLPLPKPDGISYARPMVGAQRRMGNGALRADRLTQKQEVTVAWEGLNTTEKSALDNVYAATSSATLTLPDGSSFAAMPQFGSYSAVAFFDGNDTPWYDITMTFMEV